jgi:hypothetical protein
VSEKEKKKGKAEEAAEKSRDVVRKKTRNFGVRAIRKSSKETVTEKKEEKKE